MTISSTDAIELNNSTDALGNEIREVVLPYAAVLTEGEITGIRQYQAYVKLYSLKDHPLDGSFTAAIPSINEPASLSPILSDSELPDLVYPESDSAMSTDLLSFSFPLSFPITNDNTNDNDNTVEMAIGAPSPTNTDLCGIEGVSDDEMEYDSRPRPSRTQFASLPPRRLKSYPTNDHPSEAEDIDSVSTESEELAPDAPPIRFISPPRPRSKFNSYPIYPTTGSRYEVQRRISEGIAYLMEYGTPTSPSDIGLPDVPPSHTHYTAGTPLPMSQIADDCDAHTSSDSLPDLIPISDSSDSNIECDPATPDTSEDEMEQRWIRTKEWPEDIRTRTKRVALEKRRRMARDRIDEVKRQRLLGVARENEQTRDEDAIVLYAGIDCSSCAPHNMSPCTLQLHNDLSPIHSTAASRLPQISMTDAPTRTRDPRPRSQPTTLSIDVHAPNSPVIYAAALANEHAGFNATIEMSKATVLMDEDMEVLSSTNDSEHDTVLDTMNIFLNDARHYRLVDNHRTPVPSSWDEDCVAPNMDESRLQLIQDTLHIIIQETPSSPSHDFISGQLQIFATRIPLYRRFRDRLVESLEYVRDSLTNDQWREAIRDTLNVYKESETRTGYFVETLVDRYEWYKDNYPCLNTLFTIAESTFLRGASDTLRRNGRKRYSKSIDRLLNTPIPDRYLIAELLDHGYLESEDANDYEALAYIKLRLEQLVEENDEEFQG
jgi:hypothetical protein